jgi:uncharacterized membrane protein
MQIYLVIYKSWVLFQHIYLVTMEMMVNRFPRKSNKNRVIAGKESNEHMDLQ